MTWIFFAKTPSTMKLFLLLVVLFSSFMYVSSIICYFGITKYILPVVTVDTETTAEKCGDDTCTCTSYKYICRAGDSTCTNEEQQGQTQKWVLTVLGKKTCQQLQNMSNTRYLNITCCHTNYCNNQHLNIANTTQSCILLYITMVTLIFISK